MTTDNGFTEGLVLDIHVYQARNTILIDALNIRLITLDGDEVILQSADSNKETLGSLTSGFIPIGTKTYNGICYIISAKFDANDNFIEGEIGTYPSPDYNNGFKGTDGIVKGNIINEYKPLQNYHPTNLIPNDKGITGNFRSDLFNFSINNPCEIEIQPYYDGTVNIIFTDNRNEIRNINSRFVVKANNRYEIINRVGTDSNLYNAESFETTINHIQKSNNIVNVEYLGDNKQQGQLFPGNYQYYWYYETEDGNKTDVVFESFTCSIFEGTTVNELKGLSFNNTTNQYNRTTKSNQFELDNLDTSFPILKCIYTYSSGKENSLVTTYRIVNDYRINGASFIFTHFGFEEQDIIDENELSVTNATIATARTMCQLNNRLFIANVKQKEYDTTELKAFASNIIVRAKTDKVITQELRNDGEVLEFYNQISSDINQGGYMNNKNIYYRMGYWASESYMLGIVYIMEDGSESVVYPIKSADFYNNQDINLDARLQVESNPLNGVLNYVETTGWSVNNNETNNINGLIRTQSRHGNSSIEKNIYNRTNGTDTNIDINIMYLELDLSKAFEYNNDEYPLKTIGCKFVRSERKRDAICQGYVVSTTPIPLDSSYENSLYKYESIINNKTWKLKSNCKLIPCVNYTLEGVMLKPMTTSGSTYSNAKSCITPFKFNDYFTNNSNSSFNSKSEFNRGRYFAFYSTDVVLNEEEYGQLFYSNEFEFHRLYTLETVNSKSNHTAFDKPNNRNKYYYLTYHKPYNLEKSLLPFTSNQSIRKVKADYCPGDLNQYNNLGFTSITNFYAQTAIRRIEESEETEFVYFPLSFESYVGIDFLRNSDTINNPNYSNVEQSYYGLAEVEFDRNLSFPTAGADFANNAADGDAFEINSFKTYETNGTVPLNRRQKSMEVYNIYNGAIRTFQVLKEIYNPAYEIYYPITNKMYWNETIAAKNNAENIYGFSTTKTIDGEVYNGTYNRTFEGRSQFQGYTALQRKLQVFRGDCFIGLCNKRLFINNKDNGQRIKAKEGDDFNISKLNLQNIGYSIGIIVESNQNPYLRNLDLVDINEERTRSFIPEYTSNTDVSVLSPSYTDFEAGTQNSWRYYRQPETQAYNKGYSIIKGFKNQVALLNNPFTRNAFSTRIYYSDQYVNNTFENRLRYFNPLNYKDYSSNLGQIVRILSDDNSIVCIHEHGTEIIPISQRTAVGQDLAGQVFIDSLGVLADPSNTQILSDFYGSKWQWSIIKTNNSTYAVDVDRERIWRFSGGMEMISEFKIQRFINAIFDKYKNQLLNIKKINVKTYFDYKTTDVYFVFYSSSEVPYSGIGTSYIVFDDLAHYVNNVLVGTVPNTVDNPNYIPPFEGTCPVTLKSPKCGVGEYWNGTECELASTSTLLNITVGTSSNVLGNNNIQSVSGGLLTTYPYIQTVSKYYRFGNQGQVNLTGNVNFPFGSKTYNQGDSLNAVVDFMYQGNMYIASFYQLCTNLNGSSNSFDAFNIGTLTVNTTTKRLESTSFPFLTVPANDIGSYAEVSITTPSGITTNYRKTTLGDGLVFNISHPYTQSGLYKIINTAFNNGSVRQQIIYYIIVRDGQVEEWFGRNPRCITYETICDTIIFNEKLKIWTTKSSISPIEMFSIYDRLHSFNLLENTEKIWEHHLQPLDVDNNEQYANYYGKQYPTEIEYVVGTDSINIHKVYDNIKIMGNSEPPLQITYNNDEQVDIQEDVVTRVEGNLFQANHRYLENHHYLVIGKNIPEIPNSDRRIRDKYTRFKVKYRGNKKVIITSIQTEVRPSYT